MDLPPEGAGILKKIEKIQTFTAMFGPEFSAVNAVSGGKIARFH